MVDGCLLRLLVVSEAERLARHVGDQRFAEALARLTVYLTFLLVGRIRCMDDKSLLGGHDPLNEHCHVDLVHRDAELLRGKVRTLVELAGPGALDGRPRLLELILRDAELNQLRLEERVVLVGGNERRLEDDVFKLIQDSNALTSILGFVQIL
jgi:hypothetical protein